MKAPVRQKTGAIKTRKPDCKGADLGIITNDACTIVASSREREDFDQGYPGCSILPAHDRGVRSGRQGGDDG